MKFWIREFPQIRDDVIDDDVSTKMANMFIQTVKRSYKPFQNH